MLRNFLAAALRNLERNRFYAFVSIACLSVGLAATFLAVAYIDHLRSYNRWIGDYQHVYRISLSYTMPGQAPTSLVRQRQIFSAFAALALSLAIVGLLGLASSAAEERRLEIGVRKAFGAGRSQIVRSVLWRFTKIAAAAGVIGCLLAVPLMRRWLERFQDRVDLEPWMFASACALIISVAIVTVLGHSLHMARARPITALRNE